MTRELCPRRFYDEAQFRVWPDGTVQDCEEEPHSHMSDDYAIVWALNEAEALERFNAVVARA